MKRLFALLFFCAALAVAADPWSVGKNDAVTILLPEAKSDRLLAGHLKRSAEMLARALTSRTGAKVTIMEEGKGAPQGKLLSLGNTQKLKAAGFSTAEFTPFEAMIAVKEGTLFIAGADPRSPWSPRNPHALDLRAYVLGTCRGAVLFAEKYLDARFLLPTETGTDYAAESSPLTLAENFFLRSKPRFDMQHANNFFGSYNFANQWAGMATYHVQGGHSYFDAVPKKKYAQSHPEYFMMRNGVRDSTLNHLCISNPEVQELIFQDLLRRLDRGFEVVELGQTDGYRPCECEACRNLYGTADPGEKLWILHRNVAEKVQKARPGKKVLIISYGPTAKPPQTFREFPANVMIELCNTDPENLVAWQKYTVPQGFTAYVYVWGDYRLPGYTPKHSVSFVVNKLRELNSIPLHGIFRCGFGELYGLEGPVYYLWGKLCEDPSADANRIVCEYVDRAFHEAAEPMHRFYALIDEQMERCENLDNGEPKARLCVTWPPAVLERMEEALGRAEKTAQDEKVRKRLALVRYEFDYLRLTVGICHLYAAYETAPSQALFDQIAAGIDRRNAMIGAAYDPKGRNLPVPGWDSPRMVRFMFRRKTAILQNGNDSAIIGAPLNWDTALLREKKILPGTQKIELTIPKISGEPTAEAWAKVPWVPMVGLQLQKLRGAYRFKALYNADALYFHFEGDVDKGKKFPDTRHDGPVWQHDCVEVLLAPYGDREKYFHLAAAPGEPATFDALKGMIADPLDPNYRKLDATWNGKWSKQSHIDGAVWRVTLRIPFASFSLKTPQPGESWRGNVARERYFGTWQQQSNDLELASWAPNFETKSFHNPQAFGKIIFGGER